MASRNIISVEAESVPGAALTRKDFDVLEMPFEGLAAYWLSIKKLLDMKDRKFLQEEIEYTEEPYIKYILEVGFSSLKDDVVTRLFAARKVASLTEYKRKFAAMQAALECIQENTNPHLAIIRLLTCWPVPPIAEAKAIELSRQLLQEVDAAGADLKTLVGVNQKLSPDRLVVMLLLYCLLARKDGAERCRSLLPHIPCYFFREGLAMVMDGFERSFTRDGFARLREEILFDASRKMDMANELCQAIRSRLSYDAVHAVARAYLP